MSEIPRIECDMILSQEEVKTMDRYSVKFSIDGRRTEEIVSANSSSDARKFVEARYNGSKITIWSVIKI